MMLEKNAALKDVELFVLDMGQPVKIMEFCHPL